MPRLLYLLPFAKLNVVLLVTTLVALLVDSIILEAEFSVTAVEIILVGISPAWRHHF